MPMQAQLTIRERSTSQKQLEKNLAIGVESFVSLSIGVHVLGLVCIVGANRVQNRVQFSAG